MSEEYREHEEYIKQVNCEMLESEKAVYLQVGRCDGIAECINISEDGLLLALYERGDLERYVERELEVDRSRKAEWILSMIRTILHFHNAKVLFRRLSKTKTFSREKKFALPDPRDRSRCV